ncbi:hypothetical protein M8J77_014784 [Diaphorina citri]|nr:hypothetical protein M8J77_014784 [Diaphorina citri]
MPTDGMEIDPGLAAELKVLTSKKELIFTQMQGIYDLLKKLSDKSTLQTFNRKLHCIDSMRAEFSTLLERINLLEAQIKVGRPTGFSALESMDDMYGAIKQAEVLLKPAPPPPVINVDSGSSSGTQHIKLQRLELPSFNGTLADWPLFFSLFKVNVHDMDIPKSHKLQHLLSHLTGRAQLICAGITPTEDNYDVIWNLLVAKYEDKRCLATNYLDLIFNFKSNKTESGKHLGLFSDQVGAAVAALKALEIPNLEDFILFYIGNSKLDDQSRRLFENSLGPQEIPSFDKLLQFTQNQSKILSRINPGPSGAKADFKPIGSGCSYSSHQGGKGGSSSAYGNKSPVSSSTSKFSHSFFVGNNSCILCEEEHPLFRCSKFLKFSPQDRYVFVKQHALCVNCLGGNHRVLDCPSKHVCTKCRLKHHSLLHFTHNKSVNFVPNHITNGSNESAVQSAQDNEPAKVSLCSQTADCDIGRTTVLLSTVKINIFDVNGVPRQMRFLLDNGSMCNIIDKAALEIIKLPIQQSNTRLTGLGSTSSQVHGQVNFTFASRFDNRAKYTVQALVVDKVVNRLPVHHIDCSKLNYLHNISLSDDEFMVPGPICGVLGSSVFPYVLLGDSISGSIDQPVAVNTKLGHVILGTAPIQCGNGNNSSSVCMFQGSNFDDSLQKFWELENIPPIQNLKMSPDEKACDDIYASEMSRNEAGIYSVPLPFKEDPTQLGDSFFAAKKRFLSLEKKLESSEKLHSDYNKAMSDLIDKGFMQECLDQSDTSGYFIPHHMVEKPDSVSTKLRVVFDASAKTTSGKSLNDLLYSGPKLYSNLFCVLLNFRLFPFALNGDITKMFLQIKVCEKYWKYQKLLWRFSSNEPLRFYWLMVVVFGIKPSPYLALRTVQQLISDESENFPLASKSILDKLYMDDCVASFLTVNETVLFYREVTEMFKSGGFAFTKWSSNSSQVLEAIPPSDQLAEMVSWDKDNLMLKVLGMHWSATSDEFLFKINQHFGPCTKRGMLSYILSIYDPLGLIAPVVLFVKLLIKELWLLHIDWDSAPPSHMVDLWKTFIEQLSSLQGLRFPRHIHVGVGCTFQLIGFSDASQQAYGAMVFSRVLLPTGEIKIELICAKSKVAPVKIESIPRLELCGLLLLSELMKVVLDTYSNRYSIDKIYYFTDSTVALCWAHSSPHLYHVFVANRISKIQQNIDVSNLFHVNGTDNPADGLSRGLLPEQLVSSSLYLSGPLWLYEEEKTWPIRSHEDFTHKDIPEVKKSTVVLVTVKNQENLFLNMFSRCSSWSKLLNIMVFILRFLKLVPINRIITANDLNSAEEYVIKVLQNSFFSDDIEKIKKNLICSPSLRKLCPFLDGNGILRVGGRISNSNLSYSQQHPVLLPAKQHTVALIADYLHIKNFHTGPHLLLTLLRQKYWVIGARNLVRKRFQSCNTCFRFSPKMTYPKMGDLPSARVLESKPFLNTACDYLGPISITLSHRRGQRSQKAYICLFICLATKALHLEVASDLSTPTFLNAFKRFLSRRGPVKTMLSDNGTNFVGARNHLDEVYDLLESKEYKDRFTRELAEHRITWNFNPPASPHFGGIFESNVKSFKTHFNKVIGNQLLSYEELSTLATQIESLLNSRPLCKLTSEPEDCDVLTPNHFLKLTPLGCIPAIDVSEQNTNRLSRFQLIDHMMQSFWKRWSSEYLTQLQVREKWHSSSSSVKPGMVVIIRQENMAPLNWPTGVVTKVFPGKDGVVRVALVKTPRGEFKRAVCNLCPLPTQ